jgi:hypothetical protein
MRVLITNNTLGTRAGSELYVYDIATGLLNRGHQPIAFSTVLGPVAESLRAATVPVVDDLSLLGDPPDVIHGHHHFETLIAALSFPGVPVVNFCHGWTPWEEQPLLFPNVLRYVAVDETCRDRLLSEHGIRPERIELILNFVDTSRFLPRSPLPAVPKRALAFGNGFVDDRALTVLQEGCRAEGLELDVAGGGCGRPSEAPEELLSGYDLVFARARAALEAMAVGTAVILCGPRGLGPMVTPEDWARLRPLNFGVRALSLPMTVACATGQIRRYDRVAAAQVSCRTRREASLDSALDRLLALYTGVIEESASLPRAAGVYETAAARYLQRHAGVLKGRASALQPAEPAANEHEALYLEAKSDMAALGNELRETQLRASEGQAQAAAQEARARDAERERDHWRREWHLLHESATSARQLAERTEKEREALYLQARSDVDALANELCETQLRVSETQARVSETQARASEAQAQAAVQEAAQEARARDAERERDYWRREWQILHESATWKVARSMLQSAPAQVLYPLIERVGRYVRGKRPLRLHR